LDWADYLRDEAANFRQLAETAEDPSIKQELLEIRLDCWPWWSPRTEASSLERDRCPNEAAGFSRRLAAAFWPGPLTLVLPKLADCPVADLATAGLDTIAVRVPSHPIARAILTAFARPVVAPSANRSGHVSPTTAQHVLSDLRGRIELIVDRARTPMDWNRPSSPASIGRCCCGLARSCATLLWTPRKFCAANVGKPSIAG
jgi:Telomere recombination